MCHKAIAISENFPLSAQSPVYQCEKGKAVISTSVDRMGSGRYLENQVNGGNLPNGFSNIITTPFHAKKAVNLKAVGAKQSKHTPVVSSRSGR